MISYILSGSKPPKGAQGKNPTRAFGAAEKINSLRVSAKVSCFYATSRCHFRYIQNLKALILL